LQILANKVSHLWSNENINSFIEYVEKIENETLMRKASEILCTLVKNSNLFFLLLSEQQNISIINNHSNKNENRLQNLIIKMMFHANNDHQIACNFCLLSTTLLLHAVDASRATAASNHSIIKTNNNNNENDADSNKSLDNLFNLTKSALFAIILDCDRALENLSNQNTMHNNNNIIEECNNQSSGEFRKNFNHLKVSFHKKKKH
jgi:hypothetical protein